MRRAPSQARAGLRGMFFEFLGEQVRGVAGERAALEESLRRTQGNRLKITRAVQFPETGKKKRPPTAAF